MSQYRQGDIILARMPDPEGRSIAWPHPAIIVNRTKEIVPEQRIIVIGITTKFGRPLKTGHFLLPWSPEGHKDTGLTCECVAKCEWKTSVDYAAIVKRLGFTPPAIWEQIVVELIEQIKEKRRQAESP